MNSSGFVPITSEPGFTAAGHAVQVDAGCIYVIVFDKVFCQGNGFVGGGLAPIVQLRRKHDHLVVIVDGFNAEIFHHVCADALKIQPFPARKSQKQGIGFAAIIAFGNVAAEMDVSDFAVQHVVVDETALGLRARREGFLGLPPCRTGSTAAEG